MAADSARVVVTEHARARMRKRRISLSQVLDCLRRGRVVEPAHLTIHGDWKATVGLRSAGDDVRVAVALEVQDTGDIAVVVTAMLGQ